MTATTLKLIRVPIDSLIPAEYNPRKDLQPSDPEYKAIKGSLEEFGYVDPLIINKDNTVISGHQRLKVLREQGYTQVDVIRINVTKEKEKALNVALNKITGAWDLPKLKVVLGELSTAGIDIKITGWTEKELEKLLARTKPLAAPQEVRDPGEITEIQEVAEEDAAYFEGKDQILLMYSGGLDSTYALMWARKNFPEKKTVAYYSDTGYEFPGVLLNAWQVCTRFGVELHVVKPRDDMLIDILTKGWFPAHVLPCRFKYIFGPITEAILKDYPDPETTILIDGSSAKQDMNTPGKKRRKTRYHKSYLKGLEKYDVFHPSYDTDRDAMVKILEAAGCPVWPGYKQGFVRTSCWLCPGINSDQVGAIFENYPYYVDYVRKMEELTGRKQDYVNNKGIDDKLDTYFKKKNRERIAEG